MATELEQGKSGVAHGKSDVDHDNRDESWNMASGVKHGQQRWNMASDVEHSNREAEHVKWCGTWQE